MICKKGQLRISTVPNYDPSIVRIEDDVIYQFFFDGYSYMAYSSLTSEGLYWSRDVDLTDQSQLDKIFGRMGTNSYEWIEPMTEISGFEITDGKDLNDIKECGTYYKGSASISFSNVPSDFTSGTWTLEVLPAGNDGQRIQRLTKCIKESVVICQRVFCDDTWGAWISINV